MVLFLIIFNNINKKLMKTFKYYAVIAAYMAM